MQEASRRTGSVANGIVSAVFFRTKIPLRSDSEDLLDVVHLAEDVTLC